MKHTPGLWTVKNDPVAPERVVVDMGDGIVAVHPFKDWKSNADRARLIAVAPDLLAAMEAVSDEWDAYIGSGDTEGHDDPVLVGEKIAALRAAIAKAKGEA